MIMSFRWFGRDNDSVSLRQIRQIPGVRSIVWSLHNKIAGDIWDINEIKSEINYIEEYGFTADVVESVNVHEEIKLGSNLRDKYIENYIDTIKKLGSMGVTTICYNFMPVFDWLRSNLNYPLSDGSNVLAYEKDKIEDRDFKSILKDFENGSLGYTLPGWEKERLGNLNETIEKYKSVTKEHLFNNLEYFLKAVIPVAEKEGIKMAIHPDDPPWSVFSLPRIITDIDNLKRVVNLVHSKSNCITLCTGSLGSSKNNDMVSIVKEMLPQTAFMHIRNVKIESDNLFYEVSHRTEDGNIDITNIMKILVDNHYDGYVRPDHGRMIWDEKARPGYGLYDRALGIMYLWGLYDAYTNKK